MLLPGRCRKRRWRARSAREHLTHPAGPTMTISAVLLFGSRARGDYDAGSDVDLLFVTGEPQPRHHAVGNLSLSLYPIDKLLSQAADGDLFVFHLVSEAKPIYDPAGEFTRLKMAFQFRDSYDRDVARASDLGWLLSRFGDALPNAGLVNRRITWCVRSILIGRAAEQRRAIFSPAALAAFSQEIAINGLIRQKSVGRPPEADTLRCLRHFLERWGKPDPVPTPVAAGRARPRRACQARDILIALVSATT